MKDNVYEIYSAEDTDFFLIGDKPSPFSVRLESDQTLAGRTWTFYIADSRLTDRLKFVLLFFPDSFRLSQSMVSFVSAEFTDSKKTHNYLVHTDEYGVVRHFLISLDFAFDIFSY